MKVIFPLSSNVCLAHHSSLDDELQNVEMAEAEKTKERNELKIKKRDYTGYDDEEFVEGREGMRRAVLSKYDELLEGPKETVSVDYTLFCV
jgi:dihydroxyacetone kinase-like predicted kinase